MSRDRATDASDELTRRAARAQDRDHDPRELWPGVSPVELRRACDRIVDATRRVLGGEPGAPLDTDGLETTLVGRAAFRLGVGPLLAWWIAQGTLAATPPVAALLAVHLDHARRRRARLLSEAARVVTAMRERGVEPILLKGFDTVERYPGRARAFQDIDLLVTPRDARPADAVLTRLGFIPGPVRQGRERDWSAPASNVCSLEFTHESTGWGVDLHYSLGRVFHRALVVDLPFPDPPSCPFQTFDGLTLPVLPTDLKLAFLAAHVSDSLRLLQLTHLLDVVFAALHAATEPGFSWESVHAVLERSGTERYAYTAFTLVRRLAPDSVPAAFVQALEARAHRRLRQATAHLPLTGLTRPDRWNATYALMWAATPAEIARVLWRQVIPGAKLGPGERLSFYARRVRKLLRGDIRLAAPGEP